MSYQGQTNSGLSTSSPTPTPAYVAISQVTPQQAQEHNSTATFGYPAGVSEEKAALLHYPSAGTPLVQTPYSPFGQVIVDLLLIRRITLALTLLQFICLGVQIILCATLKWPHGARPLFATAFALSGWTIAQVFVGLRPFVKWLTMMFGIANMLLSVLGIVLTFALLKVDSFRAGTDWAIMYASLELAWILIMYWTLTQKEKAASSVV